MVPGATNLKGKSITLLKTEKILPELPPSGRIRIISLITNCKHVEMPYEHTAPGFWIIDKG